LALAESPRCFVVPSRECPVEGGRLGVTQQRRDFADRQLRARQVALSHVLACSVEQLLVRDPGYGKTALE
jgi:hypothetical protein